MGSGSWSTSTYRSYYATSYATKSRDEIFDSRGLHEDLDLRKSKTHVRESRDSEEHPESTPFFIALDETGSMGSVPEYLIRNELPKLMDSLIEKGGLSNPQILFMGVGDHECDRWPCQVGQFESSTELITGGLSKINLEGGGGGNGGESYLLPWIIAANHTSCDSFEKRGKKGFLFTIGDEPTLTSISKSVLTSLTGRKYEKDITWQEAFELAKEKFHVFHIHVNHGNDYHGARVRQQMSEFMQDHLLISRKDAVVDTIVTATLNVLGTESGVQTPKPTVLTEDAKFDSGEPQRRR